MSTTKNLLVELFVEELPPKSLKKLGEAFAADLAKGLRSQGLAGEHSAVTAFASPRRLAVHVSGGLVAHELGHVPRRGEATQVGPLMFSVMLTRGGAVRWFKVTRAPEEALGSDGA